MRHCVWELDRINHAVQEDRQDATAAAMYIAYPLPSQESLWYR
jgi:hypothetical protein